MRTIKTYLLKQPNVSIYSKTKSEDSIRPFHEL